MTPRPHSTTQSHVRLRLKPTAQPTGHVDGAWWPRSLDLPGELTTLAEELTVRLGRIERVAYALSAWDTAPRKREICGIRVRLEGFSYQDTNVIHVTGTNRERISLLVIPPRTTDTTAHNAMTNAGHRDNTDKPAEILAAATLSAPQQAGHPTERRGIDGGAVSPKD